MIGDVVDRVISKLGGGDEDLGFTRYRQLPDPIRFDLRNRERDGRLSDQVIAEAVQIIDSNPTPGERKRSTDED